MSRDENQYRVHITSPPRRDVSLSYLGDGWKDEELSGFYESVDDLPHWMQESMAALWLCELRPMHVKGLGTIVSDITFWLDLKSC